MNLQIVCVGKLKEKYWTEALSEYRKRLNRFCNLSIAEVREEPIPNNASVAQSNYVKQKEGKSLAAQLKPGSYIVALDINGSELTSVELAQKINDLGIGGRSDISFIIGGSLGLSEDILKRCDLRLSFSKLTFPHQMIRVVLLEQLYRSFKINRNETYHK
ncbi:MAG TPA: 23S rRNA (pseudouridine(1915)-N(3))-methyltransferase RlmH [Anaerovoracaceae bacterium]|nr:23S rRNA (pseudouridine(1915)-N(3))-methyltransferase RlmH [Anaerovoracaceae bacterium]